MPHEVILPPRGVRRVAPKGLQTLIVMAEQPFQSGKAQCGEAEMLHMKVGGHILRHWYQDELSRKK